MPNIKVWRQDGPEAPGHFDVFDCEMKGHVSVAVVLADIAMRAPLFTVDGREVSVPLWDCGCLESRCGACSMLVNGKPMLACDAFIDSFGNEEITVEPLSKFPVVKDLVVDRDAIFNWLKEANMWVENYEGKTDKTLESRFNSAQCMMCGCCLEICPSFTGTNGFHGALLAVNDYRLMALEKNDEHRKEMRKEHEQHFYASCARSLACVDICPAKIPVDKLISRSNAASLWGKR